jgi:hypothetical protein
VEDDRTKLYPNGTKEWASACDDYVGRYFRPFCVDAQSTIMPNSQNCTLRSIHQRSLGGWGTSDIAAHSVNQIAEPAICQA